MDRLDTESTPCTLSTHIVGTQQSGFKYAAASSAFELLGMPVPLKKGRPGRPLGPAAAPARPTAASLSLSSDSELSVEPLVLLPPDGGYGWVVVVACFFMNLFTDGAIYSFGK